MDPPTTDSSASANAAQTEKHGRVTRPCWSLRRNKGDASGKAIPNARTREKAAPRKRKRL